LGRSATKKIGETSTKAYEVTCGFQVPNVDVVGRKALSKLTGPLKVKHLTRLPLSSYQLQGGRNL